MTRFIDAIFTGGILKPVDPLELPEQQRVRLVLETVDPAPASNRQGAREALIRRLEQSTLSYGGTMPSRDELHHR